VQKLLGDFAHLSDRSRYLEIVMSSSSGIDPSLARTLQAGHRVQDRVKSLMKCFDIASIPAGEGWSEVECTKDGPKALDEVRTEFKREFNRSRKVEEIVLNKDLTLTSWCIADCRYR
jgi:hypothetical protein